jgi:uncharacterized membrane protein (UPF0127 family)
MKMMPFKKYLLNAIFLLILLLQLVSCKNPVESEPDKWGYLVSKDDKILVRLAISESDQQKGFSGMRDDDWPDNNGMLFLFNEDGNRHFWMPDTYFDLDLFYLDKDLKIIDLQYQVPHFIGRWPEDRVPRAKPVWARHVLELKSKSQVGKRLKVGDQLRFESPQIPPQIK